MKVRVKALSVYICQCLCLLQELPVFVSMVRDVFAGSPEVASMQVQPLVGDMEGAVVGGTPATSSRAITLVCGKGLIY